ncbi:hypothetical protein [Streptomyces jumonjinensis]
MGAHGVPERVCRFQRTTVPLPATAQSWLIARGCSREEIRR